MASRHHFLALTILLAANGRPICAQPVLFPHPLSPRIVTYDIDVRLDAATHILTGHEALTWRNTSRDTIREIPFHLYLNAFRNNRSTFMKERSPALATNTEGEDRWGYSEIRKLTYGRDAQDVLENLSFIHPDDDNADDKTVALLALPETLSPGDTALLSIDFTAKLPDPPIARSGAREEFNFAGQWFPKPGVYIDGRWNCHQYHSTSEFFADFGVFNVRITVPEKNIVGGTGQEYDLRNNGDGTATHFYHAEDVHDFAWTTSPAFVEFKDRLGGIEIRALVQPDHLGQGLRHLEAVKTALEYFQNWYGPYPYPNVTVVDPRRGAGGTGGMEYPTLFTAGTIYGLPEGLKTLELVIIHEFGHNYWYGMVASNEFVESWLDEGINTYTEIQIMNDRYGSDKSVMDCLGFRLSDLQLARGEYVLAPSTDPILRTSWGYYSGTSYGVNSYMKPGMMLTTLQNYLGRDTMLKVMRTYVERWRFKHPTTKDFISVASEVSGQDLSWFFDQALATNAILDYSVDRISVEEIHPSIGYDYTRSLGVAADSLSGEKITPGMYLNEVDIRRLGDFKFPVEVEMIFKNGDRIREHWDGQELWKKYRYTGPERLLSATVDPDHKIPLDINYTNNSKTVEEETLGIRKMATRFLFWMQVMFDQPDVVNIFTALGGMF
jgi:hypothetical protein